MLDMMKGYLQLAAGLGEMSRRKAMGVARELVEGSPVAVMLPGNGGAVSADAVTAQVTAVADELMAIGRQNRRLITQLVRTETQAVLASLGVASQDDETAAGALERQLRALRQRVDDLDRQLRERAGAAVATTAGVVRRPGSVASWTSPAGEGSASRTARPGTARPGTARPGTAKKVAAKKVAAKKVTAKKVTAKKVATKSTAPTSADRTPSARKAGARRPGRTTAGSTGRVSAAGRSAGGRGRQQGATS